MPSIRNVSALLAAITILQLAQGMLGVSLPLAQRHDGLGGGAIGLIGAAYSAGFLLGAWYGPAMLARVGHIRIFASAAAVISSATLGFFAADDAFVWCLLRCAMGAAVALVFASVDSWIAASIARTERGAVIGVYQVLTKSALMVGPWLILGAAAEAPEPLMLAAAIQALALLPVSLTTQAQPPAPRAQALDLRKQFETAPAAVAACFTAGLVNTGVMTLAPLYAADHYGAASAPWFQGAAWLGSLLLQFPAGWISDRVDRRLVVAALAAVAVVGAAPLAFFGGVLPLWSGAALFALWGAGSLSYYGVAAAHMADRAEPDGAAQATSGLLFIWATGAIVGPILVGIAVEVGGQGAMFGFAAVCTAALAALMIQRRGARPTASRAASASVAPKQATSLAAADIAYPRDGDDPAPPG